MALQTAMTAAVLEAGDNERPNSLLAGPRFADDFRGVLSSCNSSDSASFSDCPSREARPIRAESGSVDSLHSDSESEDAMRIDGAEASSPAHARTDRRRRTFFSPRAALRALRARVRKTMQAL
ncbi:hypothetical protein FVE85_4239 [Porphyridium purpureum]|uniref:Uncharacterized protein n=1 Tax=Porphyridium purpureum TaxID=35688 RepID=A0A5J4YU85_PORPP|nr:hypothetical protein FVE85_4239 [Porphyridium purpureum]|eukprot:POR3253..scf229_5